MKKGICINSIFYTEEKLLEKCNCVIEKSDKQWEKDIYIFIKEWINESEVIIAHTSGSTGKPKPINIYKYAMVQSALATGKALSLKKDDKALLCLSPNFIAGKMMIVRAFILELNIFFQQTNSRPLEHNNQHIDFVAMIPLQAENSLCELENKQISKLIIGGAPINNELEEKLLKIDSEIYATFGMTETISHIALREINKKNTDKIYTAIDKVVFETDNRNCLVISAEKITSELIHTNDVVCLLNNKQFIWQARYDNIINSGGLKFFPEQIEKKISGLIKDDFFVAGLKNKILGQEINLLVEAEKYNEEKTQELKFEVNLKLEKFEAIHNIIFIEKFCRTKNSKINRTKSLLENNIV